MHIDFTIGWWVIPAVLGIFGLIMLVIGCVKANKEPRWIGQWPLAIPSFAGFGSGIIGILSLIIAGAIVLGHYLK